MTYSIIARCERTGRLGIGITTFSLGCGGRLEGMGANVGICKTQAWGNRGNDPLGVKLLAEGFAPKRVMEILEANDPEHAYRQIAIIDRDGNIAAHTGAKTRGWTGHSIEKAAVAFGNGLVGPQVIEAMIAAYFDASQDGLEWRLMKTLEAGRDAGGQGDAENHLPERSAAIKIVDREVYPDVDVRVDSHATAVAELRRVLEEYKLYEGFYRNRGRNPAEAMPQEVFVSSLKRQAANAHQ
jgi:uncharacterized Ntn-hydrolase superfamily protein